MDSGTSGLGIPVEYYQSILDIVTANMDCKDTSCVDVKEADFPILLISLDPDSTFPLLPSDYVECSSKYFFYFICVEIIYVFFSILMYVTVFIFIFIFYFYCYHFFILVFIPVIIFQVFIDIQFYI